MTVEDMILGKLPTSQKRLHDLELPTHSFEILCVVDRFIGLSFERLVTAPVTTDVVSNLRSKLLNASLTMVQSEGYYHI